MSAESLKVRIPEHLPFQERRVLEAVACGKPTKSIAVKGIFRSYISIKTVERVKANLQRRVNLHNSADLTKLAIRIGLAEIDV